MKMIDVLHLGRKTEKREKIVNSIRNAEINILSFYKDTWWAKRKNILRQTRIFLNVSRDDHLYFDQFRVFEAIAHGALPLSQEVPDIEKLSFVRNEHIAITGEDGYAEACRELLSDDRRRKEVIENAQRLILGRYTPEKWFDEINRIFVSLIDNDGDKTIRMKVA
jgi:spore maturation protein CgeB